MNESDLSEAIRQYKNGALGTSDSDPKKANEYHQMMHEAYKRLRRTAVGRDLIRELLNDPNPHVRCWAASHSLAWAPEASRAILTKLRDSGGPCSFDAEMTLAEYDKGRLSFDY